MTRIVARTLALAATFLLVLVAGASAATPPPDISAPSALVVEASTGDVTYDRAPNRRRAIASATKLMTALLTLERTKPSTVYRAVRYQRAARRVEDQPARGREDDGRRPACAAC